MANQYSRDLSTNVKRGNREKVLRGDWPNKAPLGYQNDRNTKKTIINEQEAYFVKKAFTLYAGGNYSIHTLANTLSSAGFRSKSDKPVIPSNIHVLLKKTFYYGIMEWNGHYYKGNHTPLISKELFDQVQQVLTASGKPKSQEAKQLLFTLRGTFTCAVCGCGVTAEKQKGINYYHCTNGKRICDQKKTFIREETLEDLVIDKLKDISFDSELIDIFHDEALKQFKSEVYDTEQITREPTSQRENLEAKESLLTNKLLEGVLDNQTYTEKSKELKLAILNLKQKIQTSPFDIENELKTFELTKEVFKALQFNDISFSELNSEEKSKIFKNLLSNSQFHHENGEKLFITIQKPLQYHCTGSDRTMCSELLRHSGQNRGRSSPATTFSILLD